MLANNMLERKKLIKYLEKNYKYYELNYISITDLLGKGIIDPLNKSINDIDKDSINAVFIGLVENVMKMQLRNIRIIETSITNEMLSYLSKNKIKTFLNTNSKAFADTAGMVYVVVNKSKVNANYYRKFIFLHEVAHALTWAAQPTERLFQVRTYITALIFLTFLMKQDFSFFVSYIIIIFLLIDKFSAREKYIDSIEEIISEETADEFSILLLEPFEREQLRTRIIEDFRNFFSKKLGRYASASRLTRMLYVIEGLLPKYVESDIHKGLDYTWRCACIVIACIVCRNPGNTSMYLLYFIVLYNLCALYYIRSRIFSTYKEIDNIINSRKDINKLIIEKSYNTKI